MRARPEDIDLVIYHDPCRDGFAAAWAAWMARGDQADYVGAQYGDPPPDVTGRHVAIVDFSYAREQLEEMIDDAASLVIMDHHKSAAWLEDFDEAIFDMRHSGCVLAWKYFHKEPAPMLLKWVEDRDLWRFSLAHTRDIGAGLMIEPMTFEHWRDVVQHDLPRLRDNGAAINAYSDARIRELAKRAVLMTIEDVPVWVVNGPRTWRSELGDVLAERDEGVALVYEVDHQAGHVRCSLRSDGSVDVSKIARCFGGGGHPGAAGFKVSLQRWPLPWMDLERHDINSSIHA